MADEVPTPSGEFDGEKRARRITLIIGGVVLVLASLFALGYLEENWRGARAWEAAARDLQAKGEKLDWQSFIPPPIPDAQNLAMAPCFVRYFKYQADPKNGTYTFAPAALGIGHADDLENMPFAGSRPANAHLASVEGARHAELAEFAKYYRSKAGFPHWEQPQSAPGEVLLALSRYSPFLDELSQAAAERPLTRFPVNWYRKIVVATPVPHYSFEQKIFTALSLRASARLADGADEEALKDVELSLRLVRDMSAEPFLIGQLVQQVGAGITLGPVWEGFADRRWNAAQLVRLQADLARLDLLAAGLVANRGERAAGLDFLDTIRQESPASVNLFNSSEVSIDAAIRGPGVLDRVVGRLTPRGLYDANKAALARWKQEFMLDAIDEKAHRVYPEKAADGDRVLAATPTRPTTGIAKFSLVDPTGILRRTAAVQSELDEAGVACALERFFLDHQVYPDALAALAPAYLASVPNDVIGGAPLHYQRTPDGRYQLYSIGWNGVDDGGRVARNDRGQIAREGGDWLWQYTSPLPPPPPAKAT